MFGSHLPPWMRKLFWVIYPVGVFVVLTWIRDLLTLLIHPYDVQILNATKNNTNFLNGTVWGWANFDLISLGLTLIIVGLTASWWVNRAQDKAKTEIDDWVNLCRKLNAQLGKYNKEKPTNEPKWQVAYDADKIAKQIESAAFGIITPEDRLLNEAAKALKEYDTKK